MGRPLMEDRLAILIDERNEAEKVAKDEYSTGYADGLTMAISILEGLID
jgi:hypothetical protein